MRCFIALELPQEIKDYLFDFEKKLTTDYAKVKWTAKKHLHITLAFLGEIDEKRANEIKERLNKIKFKKIDVKLDKIGVFPHEDHINVIWVGLKPDDKVIELQRLIDTELLDLFFDKEASFQAHLTLGRVKAVRDKMQFKKTLQEAVIEQKQFTFFEFKLMKSTLTKDGPVYEIIENYELK